MKIFRKVAMALAVVFICSGFMSITSHAGEYILFENPEGFGYYSYAEMYPDLYQAYGYDKAKLWSHYVNNGYDVMHLSMTYDEVQAKDISDAGFRLANSIIDRCEMMLQ